MTKTKISPSEVANFTRQVLQKHVEEHDEAVTQFLGTLSQPQGRADLSSLIESDGQTIFFAEKASRISKSLLNTLSFPDPGNPTKEQVAAWLESALEGLRSISERSSRNLMNSTNMLSNLVKIAELSARAEIVLELSQLLKALKKEE